MDHGQRLPTVHQADTWPGTAVGPTAPAEIRTKGGATRPPPSGTRYHRIVSKKHKQQKHHTESSPSHEPRREHDRKTREHVDDVYVGGVSKNMRYALIGVAAIMVVTLTVLFIGGFIKW